MDTQRLITELLDEMDWSYEIDRLDGEIMSGYGLEFQEQRYAVLLSFTTETTRILIRSHRIAGTGGSEGQFDPTLAAFVAVLAYDHDVQLGIDLRDGEVEARLSLELAGVDPALQSRLLKHAFKRYLVRLSQVTRILLRYRHEALDTGEPTSWNPLLSRPVDLMA